MSKDDKPSVAEIPLGDVEGGLVEFPACPERGVVGSLWFMWQDEDGEERALPYAEAVKRFGPPRLT
jgi:hypothetical protein